MALIRQSFYKQVQPPVIDDYDLFCILMSQIDSKQLEHQEAEQESLKDKKRQKKKKAAIKKNKNKAKKKGQFTSSTYRKQKCEFYNKGSCSKGENCTYSHDFQPEAAKKICKFFLSGSCAKDIACPYSHNTKIYPCRFHHIDGYCQMMDCCRFSHEQIPRDFYQEYMNTNKEYILKIYKEGKLTKTNLIEYIQEEVPKKDMTPPPPIMNEIPTTPKPVMKKDPRQRMVKSSIPPTTRPELVINPSASPLLTQIKIQQKIPQAKVQSLDDTFLQCLTKYLFSYY